MAQLLRSLLCMCEEAYIGTVVLKIELFEPIYFSYLQNPGQQTIRTKYLHTNRSEPYLCV